tara:strand:- start:380 stop:709 length:330 start_codon:yes stop_codon:yes gene_type:complete
MKLTELRKAIREEVREAIQEELKDILLEAVKSPKSTISENVVSTSPTVDPQAQQMARQNIMDQMRASGGNATLTSNNVNTFNPQGAMPGGDLPQGNLGLDQIMGLMKGK